MNVNDVKLTLVESLAEVEDFTRWLGERRDFLALDVETTGLVARRDKIRLFQIGDARRGFAFSYDDWRGVLKEFLRTYRGRIACHNLLFDSKMLKADGLDLPFGQAHDTMIMAHLINPRAAKGLKPVAVRLFGKGAYLGRGLLEEAFKYGHWDWDSIPADHPSYWIYSAFDTCLCAGIADKLYAEVEPKRQYELEIACIQVLRDAEVRGIAIDHQYVNDARERLTADVAAREMAIPVNVNSERQVVDYLESLGCKLTKRTEKGALSTDDEVLDSLETTHPVAGQIRDLRKLKRYLSAYLDKLPQLLGEDGAVHPCTHVVGAVTSRMSVTDPPLQTLPRGRIVRDAFVAREGMTLILADFEQMELRVMASDAGEESMLGAIRRGEDLHDFVATAAYGPNFTSQQRQICKNAQFAKIYYAGVEQFARTAKIPVSDAEAFLRRYDELFPGVARWQQSVIDGVRRTAGETKIGHVQTIGGRKIPVDVKKAYVAVNYRIQGSCGEVLKERLVELADSGLAGAIRLPVHDEILFEVPDPYVTDAVRMIEQVMPDRHTFAVPLEIEATTTKRWGAKYLGDPYVPLRTS